MNPEEIKEGISDLSIASESILLSRSDAANYFFSEASLSFERGSLSDTIDLLVKAREADPAFEAPRKALYGILAPRLSATTRFSFILDLFLRQHLAIQLLLAVYIVTTGLLLPFARKLFEAFPGMRVIILILFVPAGIFGAAIILNELQVNLRIFFSPYSHSALTIQQRLGLVWFCSTFVVFIGSFMHWYFTSSSLALMVWIPVGLLCLLLSEVSDSETGKLRGVRTVICAIGSIMIGVGFWLYLEYPNSKSGGLVIILALGLFALTVAIEHGTNMFGIFNTKKAEN